jgi:hypothetical protein
MMGAKRFKFTRNALATPRAQAQTDGRATRHFQMLLSCGAVYGRAQQLRRAQATFPPVVTDPVVVEADNGIQGATHADQATRALPCSAPTPRRRRHRKDPRSRWALRCRTGPDRVGAPAAQQAARLAGSERLTPPAPACHRRSDTAPPNKWV